MKDENDFSVDTEQLKNETKDTVNQVKDTIKNTNFKESAAQTKGFLVDMFSQPISTVKKVANGEENVLSKSVIIMVIYIIASFITDLIYVIRYGEYRGVGNNILSLIYSVLYPIACVLVPATLVLVFNKINKKPLITVLSTLVVATVPNAIIQIIRIVENIIPGIVIVSSPIITMFSAIGIILGYYGMRTIFEEGNETFIKKYALIELITAFVLVILARIF